MQLKVNQNQQESQATALEPKSIIDQAKSLATEMESSFLVEIEDGRN